MTQETLLSHLAALNVTLTAAGDRLRVEAPTGVITGELRAALAEHKAALLRTLKERRLAEPRPVQPHDPDPEALRIPLTLDEAPSEWLAKRGLRIAGGDPATGTLFVAACESHGTGTSQGD